ncbi:MAG TPA: archaetidylserine decarboxylase [Polyangia bacterium]|nr:archaetidylserine decarboxylase [Polyangia bacterium]
MGALSFSDRAARSVWRIFPKRALSGAIGWGGSRSLPGALRAAMLTRFASVYGIDVSEAEKPLSEYSGFDDFFTRRLRAGLRPIDREPGRVVSSADGKVVESGLVEAGKLLQAKDVLFSLDELLGDADAAARLEGGAYLITYLSPKDYHRVHAPVGGRVVGWRHVPGVLFPVNARSVNREPRLFVGNERFVTLIESEAGFCAVVMVAAVGVGHVTAAYDADVATHEADFKRAGVRERRYDVPRPIGRGDELGIFHLGSTTIVVFERGRVTLDAFERGASIKMGVGIGRFAPGAGG